MLRAVLIAVAIALAAIGPVPADTVVANGTIRVHAVLGPADITLAPEAVPGALTDPAEAIGMEARINLYPGRPLHPGDLRAPAVIDRNEIVTMRFDHGGLRIITDGRALDRAASGERVRVLNLSSRMTVTAVAAGPGLVIVGPAR